VLQERGQSPSSGRFIVGSGRPVHPASPRGFPGHGPAVHKEGRACRDWPAADRTFTQRIDIVYLFDVIRIVVAARDDIGTLQPAVQIDVAAARGAERAGGLRLRLAADRAGLERACGFFDFVVHDVGSLPEVKGFKRRPANGFLRRQPPHSAGARIGLRRLGRRLTLRWR